MRKDTILAVAACALAVAAGPAGAQTAPRPSGGRVFTDAPVPSQGTPTVAPADRAGTRSSQDSGPIDGTPFSGLPSSRSGGGAMSPADRDVGGRQTEVPNLSK